MNIQRILPLAAIVLLGGCAVGYTYQSGNGAGDYYYGAPQVEYRYQTPPGAYGGYGPYGYYGGYYGGWGPYGYSAYYGPGYYHGPYVYGGYGGYGYSHGYPARQHGPRNPRPYVPYTRPGTTQGGGFPQSGSPPPPPPPQDTPTPRSQGNAGEGRSERAKIKSEGREE